MLLFDDHSYQSTAVNLRAVVQAISFSPDGSTLATGAKDGSVFLRDSAGNVSPLYERGLKSLAVYAVEFLPNNSGVIIGGEFGWTHWKPDGEGWKQLNQTMKPVTSLAALSERTVVFGFGDRQKPSATVEIWDISANRRLQPHFQEPNGVRAVAACPAKKLIAWVTLQRKASIVDITSASKPTDFPQQYDCRAIALSADGKSMAVALDYYVKLYDVERKQERLQLKGHTGKVESVAFSPDGRTLVTGSWDETVRVWDVTTGRERANFKWGVGRVYCVTYAPDGLRLAAGGDSGRVVVWDTE